jgi:hypothetical protein
MFGTPGTLGLMRSLCRSAIPDSTPLNIVDIQVWSQEPTEAVKNDGYVIIDACGPRNLITFKSKTRFRIAPPLPVTGSVLQIMTDAEREDAAYIDVTDALGRVLLSVANVPVAKGQAQLTLDISSLSSGTYLVVVRSVSRGTVTAYVPVVR